MFESSHYKFEIKVLENFQKITKWLNGSVAWSALMEPSRGRAAASLLQLTSACGAASASAVLLLEKVAFVALHLWL